MLYVAAVSAAAAEKGEEEEEEVVLVLLGWFKLLVVEVGVLACICQLARQRRKQQDFLGRQWTGI